MAYDIILTSFTQIIGDLICCILSLYYAFYHDKNRRIFFITNSIAFFAIVIGDIYYNYSFRITRHDIKYSVDIVVTVSMLIFQLSQAYNWYVLIRYHNINLLSINNLPYLLFAMILISILIYYFLTGYSLSTISTWYQIISVSLDMLVWFFGVIGLARTQSLSIILLTFGYLLIISADLTSRCLFMLDINRLISLRWVHVTWMSGVIAMVIGFVFCFQKKPFEFCHTQSIQASCSALMLITSIIVFTISFFFLFFLNLTYNNPNVQLILWSLPIAFMFTIVTSVLLGNWFSNFILQPVNDFLRRIQSFNLGNKIKERAYIPTRIYEFKILGDFIDNSFNAISSQLDQEIKISAQVAHDIRSPLLALEVSIKRIPELPETKKILLRDAINHIRDIANNLEKNSLSNSHNEEKSITQIAVLLDYVLSERRIAFSNQSIEIRHDFNSECYGYFIEVVTSEIRRVLTNVINNACEAVSAENGLITVKLMREEKHIIIIIADNGVGINKEILPFLFTLGFTTKSKGSGLGLHHARESLAKWGGSIELLPNFPHGCIAKIKLPVKKPPSWFVSSMSLSDGATVICVDDSISIWHVWQERFKSVNSKINLCYCSSKEDLLYEIEIHKQKTCTYLIDYEFSGKFYTGFELINIIISSGNTNNKIYLVTSRSNEKEIQEFCLLKKIFIIPKFFAPIIPLRIIKKYPKKMVLIPLFEFNLSEKNYLLDTEDTIHYNEINDFISDLNLVNESTEIFVHPHLINPLNEILKKYGITNFIFKELINLSDLNIKGYCQEKSYA